MRKFLLITFSLIFAFSFTAMADDYFLIVPDYGPVLNEEEVREDFDLNGDGTIDEYNMSMDEFLDFYNKLLTFQRLNRVLEEDYSPVEFSITRFLYKDSPLLLPIEGLGNPENNLLPIEEPKNDYGPRRDKLE